MAHGNQTHGHTSNGKTSSTYKSWIAMRSRCQDSNHTFYKNYGGRGITVCDRWQKFENFLYDMGEKPKGYTIERKDNDGDYTPENCIWIPRSEQNKNTRTNRYLEYDGRRQILTDWAKELGVPHSVLQKRLALGWSIGQVLGIEHHTRVRFVYLEYNGKRQTMMDWSKETGIPYETLRGRLRNGWSIERTLSVV